MRPSIPSLIFSLLLAGPLHAQPKPFAFAWLSDTHVGSTTGAEDLRASVRDIDSISRSMNGGLRFVILSGDVTEYGSRAQLELARKILDRLTVPSFIIPGNHDTKWSESGAADVLRIFGGDRFVFDAEGIRFIGMHQGPIMKMGDGHWAPQDVRWLDSVLAHLPDPEQRIIFVTHYPLDNSIANWYEVLDRLKRVNTQAALVGHGHADEILSFEGLPGVMGRSNLRGRDSVGGYTIVDVRNDSMFFSTRRPGTVRGKPWHALALTDRRAAYRAERVHRPDFSVNSQYRSVHEKWRVSTGFTIASSPAVAGRLAIVGDASGLLQAVSLDRGTAVWSFHAGGSIYSTPAVSGRIVVFASTDGAIYALNAQTGTLLWRVHTPRPIVASPLIAESLVFIGASDGSFRALDVATGAIRWEFANVGGFVETRPLLYDGAIIFGAWDGCLYALDAKTGALRWKWDGGTPGTLFSPAACWPVGAAGKVFLVAPDRQMTAIDALTGRQVWRTGAHKVRESIGASEDGERFYVRTMQDSIIALATAPSEPTVVWGTDAHFGYDINSAMLAEKGGTLFYGTKNGLILALDAATGAVRWRHRIGVGLINTLVPLSGTDVIAADVDGTITRIGE